MNEFNKDFGFLIGAFALGILVPSLVIVALGRLLAYVL